MDRLSYPEDASVPLRLRLRCIGRPSGSDQQAPKVSGPRELHPEPVLLQMVTPLTEEPAAFSMFIGWPKTLPRTSNPLIVSPLSAPELNRVVARCSIPDPMVAEVVVQQMHVIRVLFPTDAMQVDIHDRAVREL